MLFVFFLQKSKINNRQNVPIFFYAISERKNIIFSQLINATFCFKPLIYSLCLERHLYA